ncbi:MULTISPECIES: hypothetical protein [unclassified Exiguobacterium]|uniref:hypothetical protein n=1 Tax=unclassified Exiguobacterium TaxID=2644629 RepID=UPI001BEA8FB2|nr:MULTISPECIES: hypothetical protein [unclassified Exiguobacterium]
MTYSAEILSGILGAIIGGGFTLVGSHYTISRQFKEQRRMDYEKEINGHLVALKSIKTETIHNVEQLKRMLHTIEERNLGALNFLELKITSNIHMNKWFKHSDALEVMGNQSSLHRVKEFYTKISLVNSLNSISKSRAVTEINDGIEVIEILNSYIEHYERMNSNEQ